MTSDRAEMVASLRSAAIRFLSLHRNPYSDPAELAAARATLRALREAYCLAVRSELRDARANRTG